jgi:hypothetical protein
MIASLTYIIAGIFLGTVNLLPKKASLVSRLKLPKSTRTDPTRKDAVLLSRSYLVLFIATASAITKSPIRMMIRGSMSTLNP